LMEFRDMARVHHVDADLIQRTRRWLMKQRRQDGSWAVGRRGIWHDNPSAGGDLATTAYVAWAIWSNGSSSGDVMATRDYLLDHPAADIDNARPMA